MMSHRARRAARRFVFTLVAAGAAIRGLSPIVDADGPPPEPLRVGAGGRVLETVEGRPVFVLGDTAWSLVARLTREEIDRYLRHRRQQSFNAVTFVLFSPDTPALVAAPGNAYGDAPFHSDAEGKPDTLRPATTAGANPADSTEYDYWDHVDFTIAQCRRLGFYAIVLPTWGSGVTAGYSGERPEQIVFDAPKAYAYGRWLGARYASERHVIWMLGGDRSAVYGERDYRPVFRAMAEGLADGTHGGDAFDGRADYRGLLISYHPRKDAPNSSAWFHDDEWLSFNSIQDWPEVQIEAVASDRQRTPAKPTWLYEGRYEGYFKRGYKPEQWGEWQARQQAWQTVLAGGFGHVYGHERVFSFGVDGADWNAYLDAPGARSMSHLAKLMNSLKDGALARLQPDPALVAGDPGTVERLRSTRVTASRGDTGLALLYSPNGRTIEVVMDAFSRAPVHGFWFNPRTGGWHDGRSESAEMRPFATDIAAGPGAGVRSFDPPGIERDGSDWLLVLSPNPVLR
jgi:hypothetical protein